MFAPFFMRAYFVFPARDSIVRICRLADPERVMGLVFAISPKEKIVALDSLPGLKAASRYKTGHHSEIVRLIGPPPAAVIQYSRVSLELRDPEKIVRLLSIGIRLVLSERFWAEVDGCPLSPARISSMVDWSRTEFSVAIVFWRVFSISFWNPAKKRIRKEVRNRTYKRMEPRFFTIPKYFLGNIYIGIEKYYLPKSSSSSIRICQTNSSTWETSTMAPS